MLGYLAARARVPRTEQAGGLRRGLVGGKPLLSAQERGLVRLVVDGLLRLDERARDRVASCEWRGMAGGYIEAWPSWQSVLGHVVAVMRD